MAKKRGGGGGGGGGEGGSNTGLIVTLVFFVLATITLGVFTYLGYEAKATAEAAAKKANDEKNAAEKKLAEETVRKLVFKWAGTGKVSNEEQGFLSGRKAGASAAFAEAAAALEGLKKWDVGMDVPPETFAGKAKDATDEANRAKGQKTVAENALAEAQTAFAASSAELQKKLDTAEANLKKATDEIKAARAERSEAFQAAEAKVNDESKKVERLRQEKADEAVAFGRDRDRLARDATTLKNRLEVEKAKNVQPSSLEADTPKGKILSINRDNGLAYINLGSADFVKPQLTFSILPADTTGRGAARRERKGALEIVTVLEPHLSTARIFEVRDRQSEPVLAGDLLFNPSWNASQREHVALAGVIDVDGDGKDDTAEVIRELERQGVVVDQYVDMRERAVKGPGMTEGTGYLILGERLKINPTLGTDPTNPIIAGITEVNNKIDEVVSQSRHLGVPSVAYRRYLSLIGYRMPKVAPTLDLSSPSYLRAKEGAVGTLREKDQSESKKDEKKGEPKKDPKKEEPKSDDVPR